MWVTVDDCICPFAHTETHKLNTSCLCCLVWTPGGLKLVPGEAGTVRRNSTSSASSLSNSSGENCPRTVLFPQVVLPWQSPHHPAQLPGVFGSKACGYIVGSIKAHQHVNVRQTCAAEVQYKSAGCLPPCSIRGHGSCWVLRDPPDRLHPVSCTIYYWHRSCQRQA